MAVYHQMGNDSENLLREVDLNRYRGAVLSPVNDMQAKVSNQIRRHGSATFETVFDPQLYYPGSLRGKLPTWPYFPQDVDTADPASLSWWRGVNARLLDTVLKLRPHAVCSPAVFPKDPSDEYYTFNRQVADDLRARLEGTGIEVLQSLLVPLGGLRAEGRSAAVASIATAGPLDRVYLIFLAGGQPRRELQDSIELTCAMRLIRYLEEAAVRVLVGFSSSDLLLWKAAGAADCATGKFFNLRRFTTSRFGPDEEEGGGQLWYWFEEALMAFLREGDLTRIRRVGMVSPVSMANPYGQKILRQVDSRPGEPWLALSWRQYLYWFAEFEARLSSKAVDCNALLRETEQRWDALDKSVPPVLMEERANNGSWVRPWRIAVTEALAEAGGG